MISLLTFLVALGIQIVFLQNWLVGETVLVHDNFYWNYPIFHYFAECLSQGFLPLWDHYNTGGQPFYPVWLQFRLLDPFAWLVIFIGKAITTDTAILFNWLRWIQSWFLILTTFAALHRYTSQPLTRVLLILSLSLSSFLLGSFHQDGIISQFLWMPSIFILLRSLFFDGRKEPWRYALMGSLIGLNWQSYHFAGTWIWLASFLVTALLFYRSEWKVWIRTTGTKFKLLLLTLPVMLMMAPNIVCLLESKDYVFPLRRLPSNYSDILSNGKPLPPAEGDSTFIELGLRVPSELMNYTGAYIKGWNLLQTLSPIANGNTHGLMNDRTWGHPTESYIFLGALIWAIAIYGFFVGKHPHRTLFAVPLLVFGLLMMGPPAGLHRLLSPIFPPLWFVRHTQLFLPFFLFSGFYFFCIGCEAALKNTSAFNLSNQWKRSLALASFLTLFLAFSWWAVCRMDYQSGNPALKNLLWIPLLAAGLVLYLFRKWLTGSLIAAAFLVSQSAVCLLHDPYPERMWVLLFIGLGIPLTLWLVFRRAPQWKWLQWSAVFALVLDLSYSFYMARRVYGWQPPASALLQVDTHIQPFKFKNHRSVFADYPMFFWGHQAPRYLGLFYREFFGLSSVFYYKEDTDIRPPDLEFSLKSKRWNSYLLLKDYFHLVNEGPVEEVREALRIGQAVLFASESDSAIQVRNFESGKLEFDLSLKNSGFAYWADGYTPSWRAKVDGQEALIEKRAGFGKQLPVKAGTHRVEFYYEPRAFLWALWLFLLAPLITLAGSLAYGVITRSINQSEFSSTPKRFSRQYGSIS